MVTSIISLNTTAIRWVDVVEYPKTGTRRKNLLEDANCQYVLVSLAAGSEVAKHTSPRNATVNVIEGEGILTMEDKEISLEAGVFAFVPANMSHAIKAVTNIALLLTLSAQAASSNH